MSDVQGDMSVIAQTSARCTLVPVHCCVCGSDDGDVVGRGQDYEYETTADVFRVVRCRSCGLYFLNPRPAAEDLRLIYPKEYYSYNYSGAVHPIARAVKAWLDARKGRSWLKDLTTTTPRILDVGCGDGRYLRMFDSWGVPKTQIWGTELDATVVQQLQEQGFQVREGVIEVIHDVPMAYFDLIVLLQVIEHVADPPGTVRRLAELLAPGGILVIETPNVDSLDFRLFCRRYWGGYHFPRHWNFFNSKTLSRLLTSVGLHVVRVRYLPAHTFWLYSIHHIVKYAWGFRRLSLLLNPLRNIPLLALATGFDMLRATLGFKTSNMQVVARKAANT